MKEIAPNIYASTEYPGVNVGFIVTEAGAIAIDAPPLPADACAWRQRILETARGPLLYAVLTDHHPDRALSAGLLNAPLLAGHGTYEYLHASGDAFWRSVVETWARRFPEAAAELANVKLTLPQITFTERLTLHKGEMPLTLKCVDGAGPGSIWVHLPEQEVLFAGDTIVVDTHPILAAAPDTGAWLATLTEMRRDRFRARVIVPGRGPLCDKEATRPLSEYIQLVRRRMRSLHAAGRPKADVSGLVAEFLALFPVPEGQRERLQRRVKAGLDQVYEELKRGASN